MVFLAASDYKAYFKNLCVFAPLRLCVKILLHYTSQIFVNSNSFFQFSQFSSKVHHADKTECAKTQRRKSRGSISKASPKSSTARATFADKSGSFLSQLA